MKRPVLCLSFLVLTTTGCSTVSKPAEPSTPLQPILVTSTPDVRTGYANVNGLRLYYEMHGRQEGVPLILLHGGGSSIEVTYSKILPYLEKNRFVIALDEQNHGRSSDRPGPVRFETSADDVAALLKSLKIEKADVMGFSNGASVALQVAIRHPKLVRKLVFISSFTKRSGAVPGFWTMMKGATFESMPQPLKDAYLRINDDPKALRSMHDKDLERMHSFKDVPDQNLTALKIPTLVVLGDRDVVTVQHAKWMTTKIQGARLLVLPGTHGDFLGEIDQPGATPKRVESTASLIEQFLDGTD